MPNNDSDVNEFDLIVIGAGPGGYVAAIRAAQLGMKTACIDKRASFGGTCLNVGCIPSKALLQSSEYYHQAVHHFADHGIKVKPALDLKKMMARKDTIVGDLTKGIQFLFKKNKVTGFEGTAKITAANSVEITTGKDQGKILQAKHILIATGSESTPLAGVPIDEQQIVTSTGALEFDKVPNELAVIGAGVIGLELGSVWMRLGAKVTVIEYLERILPGMEDEIASKFQKIMAKQGMEFKLGTKVTTAKLKGKDKVELTTEPAAGGKAEVITADKVLVAIGRRPYVDGLGLDELGITRDGRGFITVDADYQTNVKGIYAIGDCITGMMLAHKAEDEGVAAVERMAGQKPHIDYNAIPGVVYTHPEVAVVGKTKAELDAAGIAYTEGTFPLLANSRAKANSETDGLVKILADKTTDRLLGCHIISPNAGEMIHEAVTILEFSGSAEDMARLCHAHPTYSEAMKEAALATAKRPIHA